MLVPITAAFACSFLPSLLAMASLANYTVALKINPTWRIYLNLGFTISMVTSVASMRAQAISNGSLRESQGSPFLSRSFRCSIQMKNQRFTWFYLGLLNTVLYFDEEETRTVVSLAACACCIQYLEPWWLNFSWLKIGRTGVGVSLDFGTGGK